MVPGLDSKWDSELLGLVVDILLEDILYCTDTSTHILVESFCQYQEVIRDAIDITKKNSISLALAIKFASIIASIGHCTYLNISAYEEKILKTIKLALEEAYGIASEHCMSASYNKHSIQNINIKLLSEKNISDLEIKIWGCLKATLESFSFQFYSVASAHQIIWTSVMPLLALLSFLDYTNWCILSRTNSQSQSKSKDTLFELLGRQYDEFYQYFLKRELNGHPILQLPALSSLLLENTAVIDKDHLLSLNKNACEALLTGHK